MRKIEMLPIEVDELLEYENRCGLNILLQEIVTMKQANKNYSVFKITDDNGLMLNYSVEERK